MFKYLETLLSFILLFSVMNAAMGPDLSSTEQWKTLANQNANNPATQHAYTIYNIAAAIGDAVAIFVTQSMQLNDQLQADMNDLNKKNVAAYNNLQKINPAGMVDSGSPALQHLSAINKLAQSITPSDKNRTPKKATREMVLQAQNYVNLIKRALSLKKVYDFQASLEKVYAQRITDLAKKYASATPTETATLNKITQDVIKKCDQVLRVPINASKNEFDNVQRQLGTVRNNRSSLLMTYAAITTKAQALEAAQKAAAEAEAAKQAQEKILASQAATDKAAIADMATKLQREVDFSAGIVTKAAAYQRYAPTQVDAVKKLANTVNECATSMKNAQAANDAAAAKQALNQALAQHQNLLDALTSAQTTSDKVATAKQEELLNLLEMQLK